LIALLSLNPVSFNHMIWSIWSHKFVFSLHNYFHLKTWFLIWLFNNRIWGTCNVKRANKVVILAFKFINYKCSRVKVEEGTPEIDIQALHLERLRFDEYLFKTKASRNALGWSFLVPQPQSMLFFFFFFFCESKQCFPVKLPLTCIVSIFFFIVPCEIKILNILKQLFQWAILFEGLLSE